MRHLVRLALPLTLGAVLVLPGPAAAQVRSSGLTLLSSTPTTSAVRHSDLAFWGDRAYSGNYSGFKIFDTSNPAAPVVLSNFVCAGAPGGSSQGDISVWENRLVFRSVDTPQTSPSCATRQAAASGWEGVDIFDVSNPAAPRQIASVATDCGSHTHTLVPDLENNRLLLYIGVYPASAISSTPTAYGNTCERLRPDGSQGHDKISIVSVPLLAPQTASVIAEVQLGLTGNFTGVPGYKGCHDIQVFLELEIAAGACLTEGVIMDISNPANPVITQRLSLPAIDNCARTAPTTANPLCLWHSATFTWDGKYVVFGDEAGGGGTPECESSDPASRGAFWLYRLADLSGPLSSFKIPRPQPSTPIGQVCTAHLMNFVPINGKLVLPTSWYTGGTSVIDWTRLPSPTEIAYFEYEPTAPGDTNQTYTWTTYWYNDVIYTNDGGQAAGTPTGGQRGFETFHLNVPWRSWAWNLPRFNPQTQENVLRCRATVIGQRLRARRTTNVTVRMRVLGQPVVQTRVNLRGPGIRTSKMTNTKGEAIFAVRPARAGTFSAGTRDTFNMLGCRTTRTIAAAPRRGGGQGTGGAALTGRTR